MDKLSPREIYILYNCVKKAGHMVADEVEFVFSSRNMRSFQKLKSKLEIIMEKRMLDTCQRKYVL